jgi:hypothetical protein
LSDYQSGGSAIPPFGNVQNEGTSHDCGSVTFRWSAWGVGGHGDPVSGISVLNVVFVSGVPKVDDLFVEFNSGAAAEDLGYA